jgi:hypothetical protein
MGLCHFTVHDLWIASQTLRIHSWYYLMPDHLPTSCLPLQLARLQSHWPVLVPLMHPVPADLGSSPGRPLLPRSVPHPQPFPRQ